MNKKFLLIILVLLGRLFHAQSSIACGTQVVMDKMFRENPALKAESDRFNDLLKDPKELAKFKKYSTKTNNVVYEVPVVVHVISDGSSLGSNGNRSDKQIIEWINYTNKIFDTSGSGIKTDGEGGAVIPIKLVLAKRDLKNRVFNGINRYDATHSTKYKNDGMHPEKGVSENEIFSWVNMWDKSRYYNIYLVKNVYSDGEEFAGYAWYPTSSNYSKYGTIIAGKYGKSGEETLAHEFGHSMNLKHTHGYGNSEICGDDDVEDTEPMKVVMSDFDFWTGQPVCVSGTNSCTGKSWAGGQKNFMAYTNCNRDRFTPGQRDRAVSSFIEYKIGLTVSTALNPVDHVYVNDGGSGEKDGTSWQNAMDLSDFLLWADDNKDNGYFTKDNPLKVWVKKGTYYPKNKVGGSNDYDRSFLLVKNIQLYGGFNGDETLISQRKPYVNETILNGNSNVAHVVMSIGTTEKALIDGFTITNGNANYSGSQEVNGEGVGRGFGGGFYIDNSTISIFNTIIKNSFAKERGAGLYMENKAVVTLQNVVLMDNEAHNSSGDGGAIFVNDNNTKLTLYNCTVVRNKASDGGAIRFDDDSTFGSYNSIYYGNTTSNNKGTLNENFGFNTSKTNLNAFNGKNESSIQNNIIQYYSRGINNKYYDPKIETNGFKLISESGAINGGDNSLYTDPSAEISKSEIDIAGNKRVLNLRIDLGAWEKSCTLSNPVQSNKIFSFCQSIKRVSDLLTEINVENTYVYKTADSNEALANNTVLVNGTIYYIQTINTTTNCESERVPVQVIYINVSTPIITTPVVTCSSELRLKDIVVQGTNIKWYSSLSGGTALSPDTLIESNVNYYASQTSVSGGCESSRAKFSTSIPSQAVAPSGVLHQRLSRGKLVKDIETTGTNVKWFTSASDAVANTNSLDSNAELVSQKYYAVSTSNSGCRSIPVEFTITIEQSLNVEVDLLQDFRIYPVPFKDEMTVEYENIISEITIYNSIGQKVFSAANINAKKKVINTSKWVNGTYIIQLKSNNKLITKKVIK